MALELLHAIYEAIDSAVVISETARRSPRSKLGPLFGFAAAGFLTVLALTRWLGSFSLAPFCVLPPSLAALIAARRAWIAPTGKKPFLAITFGLGGISCLLFLFPFLLPDQAVPAALAGSYFLAALISFLLALGALTVAYLRDEWHEL